MQKNDYTCKPFKTMQVTFRSHAWIEMQCCQCWNKMHYHCNCLWIAPESKVHGANRGPNWGRQDPGGPHVGSMNLVIWDILPHVNRKITENLTNIGVRVISIKFIPREPTYLTYVTPFWKMNEIKSNKIRLIFFPLPLGKKETFYWHEWLQVFLKKMCNILKINHDCRLSSRF